jgi:hypothetical protein
MKKVFTCNDFTGHWPVGSAAIIVAEAESEARDILDAALKLRGLKLKETDTLTELPLESDGCVILCDGDY